jgi:electron transport complex protein RnfG
MMVALDVKENKLIGVAVTTHAETAGLGAKAQSDPKFGGQFKGASVAAPIKVTQDGGSINAISGATLTSRAVCGGVSNVLAVYEKLKPQILEKMKEVK